MDKAKRDELRERCEKANAQGGGFDELHAGDLLTLLDDYERLENFKTAVVGWREHDWPEGFDRFSAAQIELLGLNAESSPFKSKD